MIVDAQQLEDKATLSGPIAIIGGGAAGITLAVELARQFKDVIVLESGGLTFEQDTQALYDGPLLGHNNTNIDRTRLRFLGGSTNHWSGKCAQLDEVDFRRVGGPFSGWPIKLDDLIPYYRQAFAYCQLGAYTDNSNVIDRAKASSCQIVESDELEFAAIRASPPTRFADHFKAALESNRVKVYLHANVTDISIADSGGSVASLDVQTLGGRKFSVTAAAYVLCCGGIENARVLLSCTRFFQTGIGNEYDLVGRFFMDHLSAWAGRILPMHEVFDCPLITMGSDGGVPVRTFMKNTARVIERQGRSGCTVYFQPMFDQVDPILAAARRSSAYVAYEELAHGVVRGGPLERIGDRVCDVLDDLGALAIALSRAQAPSRQNGGRKVAGNRPVTGILVRLEAEQTPNPDSRVVLTDQLDALGMRRAGLDWRINDRDRNSLYETTMALAKGVGASGFGRMLVEMEPSVDLARIQTTWHHMGTTRMDDDKRLGVVDRNCRVHGLANLFVAGSSVFPTVGRVNPTLTIVALAIRLAEHLKQTVKGT